MPDRVPADRVVPPARRPTRLVLLGHPVAHSLSPTFQNAALDAASIPLRYEILDVPPRDLARTVDRLRASGAAGNATVPHKAGALAVCDRVTDVAATLGAVNTFWCADDGALVGDNTDAAGAVAALSTVLRRAGERPPARVAVLGAGGAAAALIAAVGVVLPRAAVGVWARGAERAAALVARFDERATVAPTLDAALGDAQVVVNATPLGLAAGDVFPCPIEALAPGAIVLDLVYGAAETAWVRAARAAGYDASDGLVMLVEQGAAAFTRWFGRSPDRARMWAAVQLRTGRTPPNPPAA